MAAFVFTESDLRRLFQINQFEIPQNEMVFFGLRGCLPMDARAEQFLDRHSLVVTDVNYLNPRCTIGQWIPARRVFTIFPGSTVPHMKYIQKALARGGAGANRMFIGYYTYTKGKHRPSPSGTHDAWRHPDTELRPILRTGDDLKYEITDKIELAVPYDNLHAAWSSGTGGSYSSAGCQVIVGFPNPNRGPWKTFKNYGYSIPQTKFRYALLEGLKAAQVASNPNTPLTARVLFGSSGDLVRKLEEALVAKGLHPAGDKINGVMDVETWKAIHKFQVQVFGEDEADGIVGRMTAESLGITDWPRV